MRSMVTPSRLTAVPSHYKLLGLPDQSKPNNFDIMVGFITTIHSTFKTMDGTSGNL